MLKQILDFFRQQNKNVEIEQSKTSTTIPAKVNLLQQYKQKLAELKEQEANYAGDVPIKLLDQIRDYDIAITVTEQAIRGELSETDWKAALESLRVPLGVALVSPSHVESELKKLYKTLEKVSDEPDYVSAEAKAGAVYLIDQAKQELPQLEKEWQLLNTQPEPSQEVLRALRMKILSTQASLSILVRRGIHRKSLNISEAQLAQQQSTLSKDALQTLLQPFLNQEQEKVQSLEEKDELDPYKQRMLPIHRRNVELYQQMLTGERPYAPLALLNQISFQEQALTDIDTKLADL